MDYRAAVAVIRSERDREIARVRVDAARAIERARAARDCEIRQLAEQGLGRAAIAAKVGYSAAQTTEILSGKREEYNRRRAAHYWRVHAGGKAA